MNVIRAILLIGIPCGVLLTLIGMVMAVQHWPFWLLVTRDAAGLLVVLLILAWVFAFRSRTRRPEISFDSF